MPHWRLPEITRSPAHTREGGFLMASAAILILIIVAVVSSFNFVLRRDYEYQANFALGQRMAEAAIIAHSYAQTTHYESAPNTDLTALGDLFTAANMNPPDNMSFDRIGAVPMTLEIRGANAAPIDLTPTDGLPLQFLPKAASAYLHLKIRPPANIVRLPSENIALLAGASSRNMSRVGIVGRFEAGDTCDGDATRVRWGTEPTACLNDAQITALGFTDVKTDDIIVPAWETALANMTQDVVLRFPQPEREGMNLFADGVDMRMDGNATRHAISNAGNINTETLTMDKNSAAARDFMGTANIKNMTVRAGSTATMLDAHVTNRPLTIMDQSGDIVVLNVRTGDSNFGSAATPATSVSVAGVMSGTGQVDTVTTNPTSTDQLNSTATPTTIDQLDNTSPLIVAVDSVGVTNNISGLTLNSTGRALNIAGTLVTDNPVTPASENVIIKPVTDGADMPIFAAELATIDNTKLRRLNGSGTEIPLDWSVGSIDQRGHGAANFLRVETAKVEDDCIGHACPDSINDPPGGGI